MQGKGKDAMQRLMLAVCAVLTIASVFGAAGAATAALTVTIVQPATNPSSAEVDETVAFEAVAFNDGQELEYANVQWLWEFGDATQSTNNPTSHAYVAAGDYTVTVTATFNQAQASATTHVIVEDDEETPKITGFDSSLSIYVGFRGHWINFATGQSEFAEIEAPVAVFQPGEQVADDPDTWGSHLINYPQAPTGWCFFSPDESEPMEMHVIVRDTQDRLGDVVITDRDTGAPVGTITANDAGSEIDGYVTVSPSASYFLLNVRDKSAGTMMLAATDNSKVEDAIVITHSYGFNPNRGDQHACKIGVPGPWGDPEALDDTKVALPGPGPGGGFACAGPRDFFNDADDENQETPLYNPLNKRVLQDVNPDSETLPQPAYAAINAAVNAARATFTGGAQFLSQFMAPPFSQGTVHWIFSANGHITSLVCLPYAGKPDDRGTTASAVDLALDWSLGDGHLDPSFKITWKYGVTAVQKRNWRVGSPIPVGDLFGFTGVNPWPPDADPLEPITTEV
ncbi:MAG TPA: hypothetical protein DGT21_23160, partial [Armatimonadetes bacterium]|nr:hypothetical protein [Armatimonadota bacterium]